MTTLKDFMEAIDYQITEGSDYMWRCFGDHAHQLDSWNGEHGAGGYTICCVFDKKNQTVYSLEAWDYGTDTSYRWIHPGYLDAFKDSCRSHGVEFGNACDTHDYTDLEVAEDLYEKARAMIAGEAYDRRVQVPLTLEDDQMFELMKMAHEQDITLNQLVENLLREVINNEGSLLGEEA